MLDIHGESAPSRAWRRFKETFFGVGGSALALLLGAAASAGSTWLSEGRSLRVRILIAFGFGLIGAVAAGSAWYAALFLKAPYSQRDAAREELSSAAVLEALLEAIADRLETG